MTPSSDRRDTPERQNPPPLESPQQQMVGPLSRQYQSICRAIRRQANFIDTDDFNAIDYAGATLRVTMLEERWNCFNNMHLQLLAQVEEDEQIATCESTFEEAESVFLVAMAALRGKVHDLEPKTTESEAGASGGQDRPINVSVKLDRQEVKNTWGFFDGSLLKWQSFHDGFVARIHNDGKMSNVEKFTQLKSSLKGSAQATLGEWHLTEDSYLEAWDRLNQIYNKKYPIIREHLRHFDSLPAIKGKATADELQRLSNGTHEMLRQLRAMQLPVDSWDMMVVHQLHERLDADTARQWELQRSSDTPAASEMLSFLDKQASAAAPMDSSGKSMDRRDHLQSDRASRGLRRSSPSDIRSSTPYGKDGKPLQANPSTSRGNSNAGLTNKSKGKHFPCEACSGDHMVYDCDEYLSLNLNARWAFVRARSLCANCLKRGHSVDKCFQPPCSYEECKKKDPWHNSTLCPGKVGKNKPMGVRKVDDCQKKG